MVFTSCEPLEDINAEIDAQSNPIVGTAEYTITDEDYEELGLTFGSFSSIQQVKDSVPQLLSDLYPAWGEGSTVNVNFNLYVGRAEGVDDRTGATKYTFTNADYAATGSNAFGFYPDVNPISQIPAVLNNVITSPVDGDIVLASYDQYTETPQVGLANVYAAEFPADFTNFTVVDLLGSEGWTSGSSYAQGSGYSGGNNDNEDWLVSPEINLTGQSNLKFQIEQEIRFHDANLNLSDHVNILVSEDYSGDVTTATWNEITLTTKPDGSSSGYIISEDYDLSMYDNKKIFVAFRLRTSTANSPRWRIRNFAIKVLGATGNTDAKGTYFTYDGGNWSPTPNTYYLSTSDYDSMGTASGQPGRYNNFSSSIPADNYLPTLLSQKYPFAQEEDQIFGIYKYYSSSSGLGTRGQLYTYTGGTWMPHQSTIADSLQFGFENGAWLPDNTIAYTFTNADYTTVYDALKDETGYEAAASNLNQYGNFGRPTSDSDLNATEPSGNSRWNNLMMFKALPIVLNKINPSAADGQKYLVTVSIYNGSSGIESFNLIKENGEWIKK